MPSKDVRLFPWPAEAEQLLEAVRARAKALGVAIPRGSDAALLRLALAVAERAPESAWREPAPKKKRRAGGEG